MYTPDMLVEHAYRHGVRITARQIEEWNKAGFLPKPERQKMPGQGRGRPPYQYPDPARDAVVWLGRHRRLKVGSDNLRFWMCVEGFDYIDIDVNAFLRGRTVAVWEDLRQILPSLPDLDQVLGMTDEDREMVLDEIDANITAPLLQYGSLCAEQLPEMAIGAASLGIYPGDRLTHTPPRTGADDDGECKAYPDYLLDAETRDEFRRALPHLTEDEILDTVREFVPQMADVGNLAEVYRVAAQGGIDRRRLRFVWAIQKTVMRDQDLIKRYKYAPLLMAMQYLAMERIFMPSVVSFLRNMTEGLEMVAEDPDMPRDLAAKLRAHIAAARRALSDE